MDEVLRTQGHRQQSHQRDSRTQTGPVARRKSSTRACPQCREASATGFRCDDNTDSARNHAHEQASRSNQRGHQTEGRRCARRLPRSKPDGYERTHSGEYGLCVDRKSRPSEGAHSRSVSLRHVERRLEAHDVSADDQRGLAVLVRSHQLDAIQLLGKLRDCRLHAVEPRAEVNR